MTYSSLMVHLDLGTSNQAVLHVAADLAGPFGAKVIGIAASQPMIVDYGDGTMAVEMLEADRATMEKHARKAESEFHSAMSGKVENLSWRTFMTYDPPSNTVAVQARAADLIVIAPGPRDEPFGTARRADLGDLIMQAGRPVLLVPPSVSGLDLGRVVVGWKDTREARRAVLDALPLLRKASRVVVVELVEEQDVPESRLRLQDVTDWMKGHGVAAEPQALISAGSNGGQFEQFAAEVGAGMLVTGAYGHNRMREWVFGGVTRDLLLNPTRCCFLSH